MLVFKVGGVAGSEGWELFQKFPLFSGSGSNTQLAAGRCRDSEIWNYTGELLFPIGKLFPMLFQSSLQVLVAFLSISGSP